MSKPINKRFIAVIVALKKHKGVSLSTDDLQKITGLPIAAIRSTAYHIINDSCVSLIQAVNDNTWEYIGDSTTQPIYDMLLITAKVKEEEVLKGLSNLEGAENSGEAVESKKSIAPPPVQAKKPKKVSKKPLATQTQEIPNDHNSLSNTISYAINRTNVIKAFENLPKTEKSLIETFNAYNNNKKELLLSVVQALIEQNLIEQDKIVGSIVYKPIGDIFKNAGPLIEEATLSIKKPIPPKTVDIKQDVTAISEQILNIIDVSSKPLSAEDVSLKLEEYSPAQALRAMNLLARNKEIIKLSTEDGSRYKSLEASISPIKEPSSALKKKNTRKEKIKKVPGISSELGIEELTVIVENNYEGILNIISKMLASR